MRAPCRTARGLINQPGQLLEDLTEQMHAAAEQLQFELAARLRDEIEDVKRELRQIDAG